ncbi:serine hydrolase domain-containing protein [Marivirga arenosa]|uniref:Serine hydrolase domain-containing protein n=1 Tax=Marivirga arenosa TaxID=3059076 RepID=A0AA52EYE7_9BACT|nr:serine hydrolase domain-containing protein [Marivirga sp. BKB1-2]WNB18036.1 serine hydrolase domain-containing protein [Marivirga sp. BKB1-2]
MKRSLLSLLLVSFLGQALFAQNLYQEHFPKVDSILNHHYNKNTPGIALSIISTGKTIYQNAIGMADMENEIAISDSTSFHIASVSKQFTAYLALLLEEEGKLSMEDDIRKYLPELEALPYKISLYQLANHTHGLPNLSELVHLKGIGSQNIMTHQQVIKMLLNIRIVNFKAGEQYQYNNTGFALLAEIIERVEGLPFQQVLKERIFNPEGMNASQAIDDPALIVKNRARSYMLVEDGYQNNELNLMTNGSSGIRTTIADLSNWAIKFQQPDPKAQAIFQKMQKPSQLNSGQSISYGLGLETKKYKGLEVVFHGGGDVGYRSYILHIPAYQLSLVLLSNTDDFAPLLVYDIIDLFLKDVLKEPTKPEKTHYSSKELKTFEGTYQMFPGNYFNIIAKNDTLYFQNYGTKDIAPLPIIGDDEFLFPYIPTTKFSFYENGFIFNIADFKYDCKKVQLETVKAEEIDLSEYIGIYKNEEFNVFFELLIEDKELKARHMRMEDISLHPIEDDSFFSRRSFFGKLDFDRDKEGKIIAFRVSGQNLMNIEFFKLGCFQSSK